MPDNAKETLDWPAKERVLKRIAALTGWGDNPAYVLAGLTLNAGGDLDYEYTESVAAYLDEPVVKISKAYELRPGAVYCVQSERILSQQLVELIAKHLKQIGEIAGCQFVYLDAGLHLVEPPAEPA